MVRIMETATGGPQTKAKKVDGITGDRTAKTTTGETSTTNPSTKESRTTTTTPNKKGNCRAKENTGISFRKLPLSTQKLFHLRNVSFY